MILTFPHMGNMYIPIKALLDYIEIEYVLPPLCNQSSLQTGGVYSPEFICLPFKTMLGDFIYALKRGANVILCGSSCGQCRQGYYGEMHRRILDDLGFEYKYIDVNLNDMSVKDFYEKMSPVIKDIKKSKLIMGLLLAGKILFSSERLFSLGNKIRCREIKKGSVDAVLNDFNKEIQKTKNYFETNKLICSSVRKIRAIKIKKHKKPLKVAIIGEIFIACEPFANFEIERRLGALGVDVYNTMSVGMWIKEHALKTLLPKRGMTPHKAALEMINTDDIGGHGIDTVGNAIIYSQKKFDGIIQIYPFTCMPEIVAQSTFSYIYDKYGVPIMTLIVDELTGEAGFQTRIEAFVDMLTLRKEKQYASVK